MTDARPEPFRFHLPPLSKKKWSGIALAFFLIFILGIGNYGPFGPIPVVQGDYNSSFSHTRTVIYKDTSMVGPTGGPTVFKAKVNATTNAAPATTLALPALSVSIGDTILIDIFDGGNCAGCFSATDMAGNAFSLKVGTSETASNSYVLASSATAGSASDVITVSTSPNPARTFDAVGLVYSGITGFGNTATEQTHFANTGSSSTVVITISSNSIVHEALFWSGDSATVSISMTSTQTLRNSDGSGVAAGSHEGLAGSAAVSTEKTGLSAGSNSLTLTESSTNPTCLSTCIRTHSALELKNSSPTLDFSRTRYNFNSTCVGAGSAAGNPAFTFDYTKGSAGTGGSNCNSADILISKTSVNFQSAAGKMLEMVRGDAQIGPLTSGSWSRTDLVFRTNGTLPSFTENYDPLDDPSARLIWTVCGQANAPALFPCIIPNGTGQANNQTIYIVHDNHLTLRQETPANDLVVTGLVTYNAIQDVVVNQAVLNFTGPLNFITSQYGATATSNSNNTASQFQFGQDYYLLVKVRFDTSRTPNANDKVAFGTRTTPVNNLPLPFQFFSVPSACTDPINKAACSLSAAQPVFNFNPLDPSSWANAVIKGLVWVFTVAVFVGTQAFSVLVSVIVFDLNVVGNFLGLGAVGTDLANLVIGASTLLSNGVTWLVTGLTWIVALALRTNDVVLLFISWAGPLLAFALNAFLGAVNSIGFILTILYWLFLGISTLFVTLEILLFFTLVGDYGGQGFHAWFETTKWFMFGTGLKFLSVIFNFGIDIISAVISLLPKPLINMSGIARWPRLPIFEVYGSPTLPNGSMEAAREGNIFTLFGWIIGIVFFFAYESTTLPGSIAGMVPGAASSLTPISTLLNLFYVILFLLGAMLMFLLPAQLANAFPILDKGFGKVPGRNIRLSARGPQVSIGSVSVRKQSGMKGRLGRFAQGRIEKRLGARALPKEQQRKNIEELQQALKIKRSQPPSETS
jgi:hypothetical protein